MKALLAILLFTAGLRADIAGPKQNTPFAFYHENVLGTSMELKVVALSAQQAETAESAALAEIDRLAAILSGYHQTSEFRRWTQTNGTPVRVSPELFQLLSLFDHWRTRTGGAIDASAETASSLWRKAAAEQRLPSLPERKAAVAAMQQQHWKLDSATQSATHLTGAPLMLNSFTKSWIIDRALNAALASEGVAGAVLNIGGDIAVRGDWTEPVTIVDPRSDAENSQPLALLQVADRAVATSGGYRRGFDIAGKHYSHIIDPRTAGTADSILSATVVAASPTDAGALATAFTILSPKESARLAATVPGAEYLIVRNDGARFTSRGWTTIALAPVPPPPATTTPVPAWQTGFELNVTLELARGDGGRYRRPYVAVWIEDKDKFPLRTLALWYEKPRWLPDLKGWYHADRIRSLAEGSDLAGSVSSATRPPGKYTLKWDGKDNAGKLVKAGKYTVCIEAAREHGTYQVIRQEMEFSGTPKQLSLPANVEISSASLDYRKP